MSPTLVILDTSTARELRKASYLGTVEGLQARSFRLGLPAVALAELARQQLEKVGGEPEDVVADLLASLPGVEVLHFERTTAEKLTAWFLGRFSEASAYGAFKTELAMRSVAAWFIEHTDDPRDAQRWNADLDARIATMRARFAEPKPPRGAPSQVDWLMLGHVHEHGAMLATEETRPREFGDPAHHWNAARLKQFAQGDS